MKCLGIYRAKRFSPAKADGDKMILDAVLKIHKEQGQETATITEEELISSKMLPEADLYLSMARSDEALRLLEIVNDKCLNSPTGIRMCNHRSWMTPTVAEDFSNGIWIKRADGCAEIKEDVSLCHSKDEIDTVLSSFRGRGITEWVSQPHYQGDLVKCYGVNGSDFFSFSYPTDTGQTKFGLEKNNGEAHHYKFSIGDLKDAFNAIASKIGVPVYGGDAIIGCHGEINIIDFNDWPTFSPCRDDAARAIAGLV